MDGQSTLNQIDALLPPEMAAKAEMVGVKKAALPFGSMFALAVLAGAFIGLGAIISTTVVAGSTLPYGVTRLLAGLVFSLGLILVIVGGAELFTGNTLMSIAYTNRKISFGDLMRNWGIVYLGNLVGSIATAIVMFISKQYTFSGGVVGVAALNIANSKVNLEPLQAIALGIMCNALVCLAVWLCFSARSTSDKILAIIPPITAFVACGFEHSVANMYFIPIGLFIKNWGTPVFFDSIGKVAGDFSNLTWGNFFIANLLPVTIGNIIGGAVMVGAVYWYAYLRKSNPS